MEKRKFRKEKLKETFLLSEEAFQVFMLNSMLPPNKLNNGLCFTIVERVFVILSRILHLFEDEF